jgi:hypothetical protein
MLLTSGMFLQNQTPYLAKETLVNPDPPDVFVGSASSKRFWIRCFKR